MDRYGLLWIEILLLTAFAVILIQVQSSSEQCDKPITNIYDQFGCTPGETNPKTGCPSNYNCSHLENIPDGKCYHKGKLYNKHEKVERGPLDGCFGFGCICGDNATFNCPALSCFSRNWNTIEKGCHFKNQLGVCCGENEKVICPKNKDVAVCEVDGKTYYEGQYFTPKNRPCLNCICDQGFAGKFELPYCVASNCSSPHHSDGTHFRENCGLFYLKKVETCCQDDITCPTGKEVMDIPKDPENSLRCRYGDGRFPIGTTFETPLNGRRYPKSYKAKCECVMPPLFTCNEI